MCSRAVCPTKYVAEHTLRVLGIYQKINMFMGTLGLSTVMNLRLPSFVQLCREFYTSFKLKLGNDTNIHSPNVIHFRLMGNEFNLSITEFNVLCGFIEESAIFQPYYINSYVDYPPEFDPAYVYREWSCDPKPYNARVSKANTLCDPCHRVFQRFLAFNFSGRRDSCGVLSQGELFLIWCAENGFYVNMGFVLCTQFENVITSTVKSMFNGPLITYLAVKLNGLDPWTAHDFTEVSPVEDLDFDCLDRMEVIYRTPEGWAFCPPEAALEEAPNEVRSLARRLDRQESRLDKLSRSITKLEGNISQLFHSLNCGSPPFPPSP